MATVVGPKGQIVIEKEIRDRLGIEPGALAIQEVVGDHVEVRFAPKPHIRSLKGAARPYIRRLVAQEEWDTAREEAWQSAVREESGRW